MKNIFQALKNSALHMDGDITDKLNYFYTSIMILVLAASVSVKQYVGNPVQCWVPNTFTEPMEQYTENYCFVQNTYFMPIREYIPENYQNRHRRQIGYYQWVPLLLALEALFFYIPCIVWRLFSWQSAVNVQSMVRMGCDSRMMDMDSREKAIESIANHFEKALHVRHIMAGNNADGAGGIDKPMVSLSSKNSGCSVTFLYLSMKLLYLLNLVGQMFLLSYFLDANDHLFGFRVLSDLLRGREWEESGTFPRVTLCDFEVRVLGNVHRHTVQCVLMINMFNEKVFLFLWFWYFLLLLATLACFLYWIFISLAKNPRISFVDGYLTGIEGHEMVDQQSLRRFTLSYLKHDGVFLMRMTATHAGELVCCQLAKSLWNNFVGEKADKAQDV